MMRKWKVFIFIFLLSLMSGCIMDAEKIIYYYRIDKELSGSVTLYFKKISSADIGINHEPQEITFDERVERFVDANIEQYKGLISEISYELVNKTDSSCDLVVSGNFKDIKNALKTYSEDHELTIVEKLEDYYFISIDDIRGKITSDEAISFDKSIENTDVSIVDETFVIKFSYEGKIEEHNAHDFDEKENTMIWYASKINSKGIQFKLRK